MNVSVARNRGQSRLSLQGRFDFGSHLQFRQACDDALQDQETGELVLDMADVEYLDSTALGMMLLLRDRARMADKIVAIENCRGTVREVLGIANFQKLFPIR